MARALPLSAEGMGWRWGPWLAEDGPASGCSYAPCWRVPAAYGVASVPPNRVDERSILHWKCSEHLQLSG